MKRVLLACASLSGCFAEPEFDDDEDESTGSPPAEVTVGTASSTSSMSTTSPAPTTTTSDGSTGGEGSSEAEASTGAGPTAAQVVYLNFDGAVISSGAIDDAPENEAALDSTVGAYSPYGDDEERDEVVDLIRWQWGAFDVGFTTERPEEGDYTMIVVSPSDPYGLNALALADVDCGNANPNNLGFVYLGAGDYAVETVANAVSWATARGFGLEPSLDASDITFIGVSPEELRTIGDDCFALNTTFAIQCSGSHSVFCPAGYQNSYEELELVIGLQSEGGQV